MFGNAGKCFIELQQKKQNQQSRCMHGTRGACAETIFEMKLFALQTNFNSGRKLYLQCEALEFVITMLHHRASWELFSKMNFNKLWKISQTFHKLLMKRNHSSTFMLVTCFRRHETLITCYCRWKTKFQTQLRSSWQSLKKIPFTHSVCTRKLSSQELWKDV